MRELIAAIEQVDEGQIGDILNAVLRRYKDLFPEWEVSTVSVKKNEDREELINQMVQMLLHYFFQAIQICCFSPCHFCK